MLVNKRQRTSSRVPLRMRIRDVLDIQTNLGRLRWVRFSSLGPNTFDLVSANPNTSPYFLTVTITSRRSRMFNFTLFTGKAPLPSSLIIREVIFLNKAIAPSIEMRIKFRRWTHRRKGSSTVAVLGRRPTLAPAPQPKDQLPSRSLFAILPMLIRVPLTPARPS